MRRNPIGLAALMAMGAIGMPAPVERPPPADDRKPAPRGDRSLSGYWGIPYPHLKHVSRETMNRPPRASTDAPLDAIQVIVKRLKRRSRRKARMRLRKRRGWR